MNFPPLCTPCNTCDEFAADCLWALGHCQVKTDFDSEVLSAPEINETTEVISPKAVWLNAVLHGWHDDVLYPTPPETHLTMIAREAYEAMDKLRDGDQAGLGTELADIVLRVFDFAFNNRIDIAAEMAKKHESNKTRPYRHGGKKF